MKNLDNPNLGHKKYSLCDYQDFALRCLICNGIGLYIYGQLQISFVQKNIFLIFYFQPHPDQLTTYYWLYK